MKFNHESTFKKVTYTFMLLNFVLPYFIISDLGFISDKFVYLAFIFWIAFNYLAPILLSKLIVAIYIIKEKEDNENVFIVTELFSLIYVLSVFVCSIFYLIMFYLPREII